jgi:hypothetical protein
MIVTAISLALAHDYIPLAFTKDKSVMIAFILLNVFLKQISIQGIQETWLQS